jgi:hypothetical protein
MSSTEKQMLAPVRRILLRDLSAVQREITAYPDDDAVWRTVPGIANSGGTLALHIAGNLQHFIGATLGKTGYVRDRDAEFAARQVSRAEIDAQLTEAHEAVDITLTRLDPSRLRDVYPLPIGEMRVFVGPYLLHLAVHLGYHLGQLDYHRRIVTGSSETVGTVALPPVFAESESEHA